MIDDMLITYKMRHIKKRHTKKKGGWHTRRNGFLHSIGTHSMYFLHKTGYMEFILTTDKKQNRVGFGKNVHDLLQEDHNLSNTTIQQTKNHEQYQFRIRWNP